MNGYLVVIRHSMDDIPLGLFEKKADAVKFAKNTTADDGQREMKVLGIDATTPINVFVYEFKRGRLVDADLVVDFSADAAASS